MDIGRLIREARHRSNMYRKGREDYLSGKSVLDCPTFGTIWDQAAWLAGWVDQVADREYKFQDKT